VCLSGVPRVSEAVKLVLKLVDLSEQDYWVNWLGVSEKEIWVHLARTKYLGSMR
jgi:hypothetical protein